MMRIGTILIFLLTTIGCSHLKTIPAPSEKWSYVQIRDFDKIKDVDYCLLLRRWRLWSSNNLWFFVEFHGKGNGLIESNG
jgi:hypothetical protein